MHRDKSWWLLADNSGQVTDSMVSIKSIFIFYLYASFFFLSIGRSLYFRQISVNIISIVMEMDYLCIYVWARAKNKERNLVNFCNDNRDEQVDDKIVNHFIIPLSFSLFFNEVVHNVLTGQSFYRRTKRRG